MEDNKVTFSENARGMRLTAETYIKFKELAEEQISKEAELTEDDLNDVVIGLLITKLLVVEGKLEEKFWKSAIS